MDSGNNNNYSRHDTTNEEEDEVPPFCFDCMEIEAQTAKFYILACGKIVCAKCIQRSERQGGNKVKCSTHNQYETFLRINEQMPEEIRCRFRNSNEKQLKQIATNLEYVSKLSNELSIRAMKLPPEPTEEEINNIQKELGIVETNNTKIDKEYEDELAKLKRDLKAAEKLDEYFHEYERRAKRIVPEASERVSETKTSTQRRPSFEANRHQQRTSFDAAKQRRLSTESTFRKPSMLSSITVSGKGSIRNDSGCPTSNHTDTRSIRTNPTNISTPKLDTTRSASASYTKFQQNLNRSGVSYNTQSTPIKSILKNSSSRRSSSTGGTVTINSPLVEPTTKYAMKHTRHEQNQMNNNPSVQDKQELYRSRSNLNLSVDGRRNSTAAISSTYLDDAQRSVQSNRYSGLHKNVNQQHVRPVQTHNQKTPVVRQSISSLFGIKTPQNATQHGQTTNRRLNPPQSTINIQSNTNTRIEPHRDHASASRYHTSNIASHSIGNTRFEYLPQESAKKVSKTIEQLRHGTPYPRGKL